MGFKFLEVSTKERVTHDADMPVDHEPVAVFHDDCMNMKVMLNKENLTHRVTVMESEGIDCEQEKIGMAAIQ